MHQRPLLELEDQVVGVAVRPVLRDRVLHVLPGHRVLQLGRDDRHAVQAEGQVQRLGCWWP